MQFHFEKMAFHDGTFLKEHNRQNRDGADGGTRTPDLLITSQQLYQLSYVGLYKKTRQSCRKKSLFAL